MISILSIVHDTMVDGPGFRTSIYCAGCPNHCAGCHNPQSWDINHGIMTSTEDIMKEILEDPFANVTFSGGDPMLCQTETSCRALRLGSVLYMCRRWLLFISRFW